MVRPLLGAGAEGCVDRGRHLDDAHAVGLARAHLLARVHVRLSLRARSVSAMAAMMATSSSTAAICSG
jgi:hypothetical protein